MLIGERLAKGTDVSFIAEMIEVNDWLNCLY